MNTSDEQPSVEYLVGSTNVPAHAHALINTYFDNWPALPTQTQYREQGAVPTQYWYHELKRILNAKIHFTSEFRALPHMEYYIKKYGGDIANNHMNIAEIETRDRADLLRAFSSQLGMYWSVFPFSISDF